jgi:hypothetical protein
MVIAARKLPAVDLPPPAPALPPVNIGYISPYTRDAASAPMLQTSFAMTCEWLKDEAPFKPDGMTQEELDALPEANGPLYQGPNDIIMICDRRGVFWMTGWAGDVLCKRRMS